MKGTWGRIAGSPGRFRRVNGPASESGIEREWMVTVGKRMADEREWMVRKCEMVFVAGFFGIVKLFANSGKIGTKFDSIFAVPKYF